MHQAIVTAWALLLTYSSLEQYCHASPGSFKINEFTATISPKDKNIIFKGKNNEDGGQVNLFLNGKAVDKKEFSKDFEIQRPLAGGEYKFDFGGSIIVIDLTQMNVEALSSDISEVTFSAELEEKASSIVYKRHSSGLSSELIFWCTQNQQSMGLGHFKKSSHGDADVKFIGNIEPKNVFKCQYGHRKDIIFSVTIRDVFPKITNHHIHYVPVSNLGKVVCSGISDLILPNKIESNITLEFNGVEVATRTNATTLEYLTENQKSGVYRCIIKNAYDIDDATLDIEKERKYETFGEGGVISLKLETYSKKAEMTTTFDEGRNLSCENVQHFFISYNHILDTTDIKKYYTTLNIKNVYECSSEQGDNFKFVGLYIPE